MSLLQGDPRPRSSLEVDVSICYHNLNKGRRNEPLFLPPLTPQNDGRREQPWQARAGESNSDRREQPWQPWQRVVAPSGYASGRSHDSLLARATVAGESSRGSRGSGWSPPPATPPDAPTTPCSRERPRIVRCRRDSKVPRSLRSAYYSSSFNSRSTFVPPPPPPPQAGLPPCPGCSDWSWQKVM
jgi:hypothetical protein